MFATLYIPDFLVEAIVRVRPILRRQAVAVIEGTPPLAYVVAVNDHARQLGLHVGMTRLQAETMAAIQSRNARQRNAAATPPLDANTTSGDPRFHLVRDSAHMSNAQQNGWLTAPVAGEASEHPRKTSSYTGAKRPCSSARPASPANITIALCRRSPLQEATAHAALLDAAHALSPRVEDTATDLVVLDLAGLERLFGASPAIARELARRTAEAGLEANIAIASNPDAAIHAARGFPGVTLIPAGSEADRLGSLPIEILCANYAPVAENTSRDGKRKTRTAATRNAEDARKRIERIIGTLDRWGIRNFRALAVLPPASLSERLGADGVRLQQFATGGVKRDLDLHESPLAFEEAAEFEYPIDLLEPLALVLSHMLEQLCARLSARALSTTELRLRMELVRCATDEATASPDELVQAAHTAIRKITLPVPMNDARLFLKLLQLELQSNPTGAPVAKIRLTAEPSRPRVAQAGLFVPLAPEPEKLELTLARIYRVLRGAELAATHDSELRAGSAELLDTHQPDAFRMVRFQPPAATLSADGHSEPLQSGQKTTLLPMRVFRPPLDVEVEVRDGRPVRFVCAELGVKSASLDNLVWVAGPWRTSGNWWMEGEEENATGPQPLNPLSSAAGDGAATAITGIQQHLERVRLQPCHTPSDEAASAAEGIQQRTKNIEQRSCFSHEEWDVALATTTITPGEPRARQTHIALYRLFRDAADDTWHIAGSYD